MKSLVSYSGSPFRKCLSKERLFELSPWLVLLCVFYVFQIVRWGWFYPASDDSYIYLGYVKMAITPPFELFSYNVGEHSAGTTGILYYYVLMVVCGVVRLVTFFLPLPLSLMLGMFVLNGILFILFAVVLIACWKRLSESYAEAGGVSVILLFALVCANKKFLWGFFAGLENPLSAFLCILLFHLFISHKPFWQPVLVGAGLCATRPDVTLVIAIIPALAVVLRYMHPTEREGRNSFSGSRMMRDLLLAYALWWGVLFLLILPCYVLTGRFFPTALGTRVAIPALSEPAQMWQNFINSLQARRLWTSDWLICNYILLGCSVCLLGYKRTGPVVGVAVLILAHFMVRAALGMTRLNVEDRYVSYLWGLYALGLAVCAEQVWAKMLTWKVLCFHRWGRFALPAAAVMLVAVVPLRRFMRTFTLDVGEMNQVVVEPSRWMAEHLPEGSRICMDPAGALRVFTDFYLVDGIGLTTTHLQGYDGDYYNFLKDNGVDYVFDYPRRVPELDEKAVFESLKIIKPNARRHSRGVIGVYRVLHKDDGGIKSGPGA